MANNDRWINYLVKLLLDYYQREFDKYKQRHNLK